MFDSSRFIHADVRAAALALWKHSKKNRPTTHIISNPPIDISRTAPEAPIIQVPDSDNEARATSSDDDIQVVEEEPNTPTRSGMRTSASLSLHQVRDSSLQPKRKKQRMSSPQPLTISTVERGGKRPPPGSPISSGSSGEEVSRSATILATKRSRGENGQKDEEMEEVMIVNDHNIPKNHHTKGEASALSKFQPVVSRVKSGIRFFNSKSEVGDVDPAALCAKLDPIKTVKAFRVVHKDLLSVAFH